MIQDEKELLDACVKLRELIFEDHPESQGGMIGSPVEVVLCAIESIKKLKSEVAGSR